MRLLHRSQPFWRIGHFILIDKSAVVPANPDGIVDARPLVGGHRRQMSFPARGGSMNMRSDTHPRNSERRLVTRTDGKGGTSFERALMTRPKGHGLFHFEGEFVAATHRPSLARSHPGSRRSNQ